MTCGHRRTPATNITKTASALGRTHGTPSWGCKKLGMIKHELRQKTTLIGYVWWTVNGVRDVLRFWHDRWESEELWSGTWLHSKTCFLGLEKNKTLIWGWLWCCCVNVNSMMRVGYCLYKLTFFNKVCRVIFQSIQVIINFEIRGCLVSCFSVIMIKIGNNTCWSIFNVEINKQHTC